MLEVTKALDEVRDLYRKYVGQPAPEIRPDSFVGFPPGVDPLHHAIAEVDQLKKLSEQLGRAPAPAAWMPPADSYAVKDGFVIRVEVPGVARDSLKVFVVGGECVVRGERKVPEGKGEWRPLSIERPWGPFERRFALPAGSYPDRVTARYAEGVLELRVAGGAAIAPEEKKVEVA